MKLNFLEAGKVRNTHALRGEVKMEVWLEGEKPFSGISKLYLSNKAENNEKSLKISGCRRQGDVFLVSFEGITTVEQAVFLKGKTLYAARDEVDPKGEKVFFAELIGLPLLEEETGEEYGKILEVTCRGASELFLLKMKDGRELYFPAVPEFIVKTDVETGVTVRAPKGIFD